MFESEVNQNLNDRIGKCEVKYERFEQIVTQP